MGWQRPPTQKVPARHVTSVQQPFLPGKQQPLRSETMKRGQHVDHFATHRGLGQQYGTLCRPPAGAHASIRFSQHSPLPQLIQPLAQRHLPPEQTWVASQHFFPPQPTV